MWTASEDGKNTIEVWRPLGNVNDLAQRDEVIGFLAEQTNAMVNALRPRVAAFLAEQKTVT